MPEGQSFEHPQEVKKGVGPEPNKRQQDKIVAILESGNLDLISKQQLEGPDSQREAFLQKVAKGEIDEAKFTELILNIEPPISGEQDPNNPVELYGSVSGNQQIRGLIAEFARNDFYQRNSLNPKDLAVFLQRYPEPSALERDVHKVLDEIEKANLSSPQKRQEYEASLREFMRIVDGKRQEYYDQIKLLRAEADAKYPELTKGATSSEEQPANMEGAGGQPPEQPMDTQKKQELTPEEQQRIQRVRSGIVGRAKQLGQAEKVEDKWQFSDEFREKARREMEEAKGAGGEPPQETEKEKGKTGLEGSIRALRQEIKELEAILNSHGSKGDKAELEQKFLKKEQELINLETELKRIKETEGRHEVDKTGSPDPTTMETHQGVWQRIRAGGPDQYQHTRNIREFLKELQSARQDFAEAEAQLEKYRWHIAASQKLPFWKVVAEGLGMPKDAAERYQKAKRTYEKFQAEYGAAKAWRALREQALRIDTLIAEKEKVDGGIEERMRKSWDSLGKKVIFDKVNGRVALSYGLLGAGVAVGTALPGLGAALLLGQRIFAGLSAGIGSHQLMEIGSERRFEQRQRALQKDRAEIEKLLEQVPDDAKLQEQLEKNLAEWMAMTEIESLRKGEPLRENEEYLAVRKRYHELRALKKKDNLEEWIKERNKDFEARKEKSARGQLYRKLAATGIGTFVGAGGIGWGLREAGEALGAATHAPEARARLPVEAPTTPAPEPTPGTTAEGQLEAPQTITPTAEDLARAHDAAALQDAKVMTIKPGGSAWEAAHRFVSEGIISQREFSEAWSNPDSIVKLADGRMVHISDLHLTHAGDQVELIQSADGTYRFSVVDYVKDELRVGTAEDLHRAYEQLDRQPTQLLEDALKTKEAPGVTLPLEPLPEVPRTEEEFETFRHEAQLPPETDYFEKMRAVATLEAPFPVEYWQGQNFEDYILGAKNRWEADILYLPANVTAEFPSGIIDQEHMNRLMEWFRVRGDIVAENFINKGQVAIVLDHQPEGSAFQVIRLVSTNELKPWTQSRLIPKEVFEGL